MESRTKAGIKGGVEMNFIKRPHCYDEVQEKAYGIHVSKTCYAIGKTGKELENIREFNSEPHSVMESLS